MKLRKNSKRYIIYPVIAILTFIVFVSVFCNTAYAGDINPDEARVIAVASGTFTYRGKTYKAYSDYVSELYSKLAEDDVDLDSYQADNAINYIYENVKEGIDSGYVYQIEDPEKENVDLDKIEKEKQENKQKQNEQNNSNDETSDDTAPVVPEQTQEISDKEVEELFQKLDEDQKEKRKYADKVKATETDASITVSGDGLVIETKDYKLELSKNQRIVPTEFSTALIIISSAILIIDILIMLILAFNKCMRIKKQESKRPRKGHHRRRRIRKICRNVLTVTSAVGITVLVIIVSVAVGLYNDSKIIQNIQSSGYFRYAYSMYVSENSSETTENSSDTSQNSSEASQHNREVSDTLSYDSYIVQEKVNIDTTLKSGSDIETMDTSKYSIAPYIRRMQIDVQPSLTISSILLMIALLIACASNVFMDLRRDRGVKSIAVSTIIGAVTTFVAAVIINLLHVENKLFIEPEYLYNFITLHVEWLVKVLFVVGLFAAVVGMSLVGLYMSMRKDR